jgi:ribulose-5-phosphate 4-epimerase/fuculose-1-phosphate aldolase
MSIPMSSLDSAHPDPATGQPGSSGAEHTRVHRKSRLALGYRILGALGWGSLGDGHISARDPLQPDCFWVARYGVPFKFMSADDLVLVGPDGSLIYGSGRINRAAYYIHWPLHEARADVVSAVHCHTPYGTPFSALVTPLLPISQESCAFFNDHAIFDDEEVSIGSIDGGKRIAAALGSRRAVILRNHGLLTTGSSVDAAVGLFALMERCAEVQVKSSGVIGGPKPIGAEAAGRTHDEFTDAAVAQICEWLRRTHLPGVDAVRPDAPRSGQAGRS